MSSRPRGRRPRLGRVRRARAVGRRSRTRSGSRRSPCARPSARTASPSCTARSRGEMWRDARARRSGASRTASTRAPGSRRRSPERLGGDWSRVRRALDEELWQLAPAREARAPGRRGGRRARPARPDCSRSASPAASRPTSARVCSSATSTGSRAFLDRGVRPLVLAGKSHPADEGGKALIQQVVAAARATERAAAASSSCEDYDMTLARFLVQGVDVWLNTPRRPLEACGTSGMKAAHERRAQLLDPRRLVVRGLLAGDRLRDRRRARRATRTRPTPPRSTTCSSASVPAYNERDERGLPVRWLAMMRASIERLGARVQHEPDGARVRRGHVPPGRARRPRSSV